MRTKQTTTAALEILHSSQWQKAIRFATCLLQSRIYEYVKHHKEKLNLRMRLREMLCGGGDTSIGYLRMSRNLSHNYGS